MMRLELRVDRRSGSDSWECFSCCEVACACTLLERAIAALAAGERLRAEVFER